MAGTMRTTAMAFGCVGGLGGAVYGLISGQSRRARRAIGYPKGSAPYADGVYLPDGTGPLPSDDPRAVRPIRLAVLGDSSAAGIGADTAEQVPGALVARGLAEEAEQAVRLTTYAVSGATSRELLEQAGRAAADRPDVAVAMIGGNDVTKRLAPQTAAALLGRAVRVLRDTGAEVIVGTCPDLGVVRPIPQPLRGLLHTWSRTLARLQNNAVRGAGGHPVPFADLLAAEFMARADLFSRDQFHPSGAGYEAAAAVLLPRVCAALGLWHGLGVAPPKRVAPAPAGVLAALTGPDGPTAVARAAR
ncbi:MAG TPA: SGNH/GDSL hydrolase family protein [Pseudonocardiaceae bacterium]